MMTGAGAHGGMLGRAENGKCCNGAVQTLDLMKMGGKHVMPCQFWLPTSQHFTHVMQRSALVAWAPNLQNMQDAMCVTVSYPICTKVQSKAPALGADIFE